MHQIENRNTNQRCRALKELDRICKPDRKKMWSISRKDEIESRKRKGNRKELIVLRISVAKTQGEFGENFIWGFYLHLFV